MINSLLPHLRRFLLITAFAFWQGGFMFYGGVVVEVGTEIVGSHLVQGFVTQSVTNYLNAAGMMCLALWCWDLSREKDQHTWRRIGCWSLWWLIVASLLLQFWLHHRLDQLLDSTSLTLLDKPGYKSLHRLYLAASTVQWLMTLVLMLATLAKWRDVDSSPRV